VGVGEPGTLGVPGLGEDRELLLGMATAARTLPALARPVTSNHPRWITPSSFGEHRLWQEQERSSMSLVSATELAKALGVTTVAIRKRIWAYHADGLLG
jgi:hypothetical protein